MKLFFPLFFFFSTLMYSQLTKRDKLYQLTNSEMNDLKAYLKSKNLEVKDTILIKYDFNKESCWGNLDEKEDEYIKKVLQNFQNHISNFNKKHSGAIAANFREPGTKINKLKLWDKTIIVDDDLFLKNLIFKKKKMCGNSAIILNDGSYVLRSEDPHFDLLDALKK